MKKLCALWILLVFSVCVFATGEAGTYFNIYIPPSNVDQGKDISLVVTALHDSTFFRINDTGEDGDTDDSASGMLMTGQSYVLFLRDNGVNDDAAHFGDTAGKQDGDHFLITASKLVLVSQAAKSEWEHEWLPSTNKSGKGSRFFVYGNEVITSPNDLNVMAYQDSTYVTILKISKSTHSGTGFTNVSLVNDSVVARFMLSPGEDIIYKYPYGRDVLKPGETYMVLTNKDVTVQYGALYTNESDGGGYVPSSNGTGAGELFYFAVPFEDSLQQEVRIVSWSDSNNVALQRYSNGQWLTISQFNSLARFKPVEWVGKTSGQTFATIFRVTCTHGKKVSVLEDNWIETGSMVTSDISTMAPSDNGTSTGQTFAVYMPIPTEQGNVTDPFTGHKLPAKGTHAYIFGNKDSVAHVTVKDLNTNGSVINRTYTVPAGYYADCGLDSAQWVSIYNGTGTLAGGPNRPYLLITSDQAVSVEANNFNDNWMMYFGAAIPHGFDLSMTSNKTDARSGDTVKYTTFLNLNGNVVQSGKFSQTFANGLKVLSSFIIDSTTRVKTMGTAHVDAGTGKTYITYPVIQTFNTAHKYRIINTALSMCSFVNGTIIGQHEMLSTETVLTANVHGGSEMAEAAAGIVSDSVNMLAGITFSVSEASITEGVTETCTAANCNSTTYSWNFGDGHTGTGRVAGHAFQSTGNYIILLHATNAAGCSANAQEKIDVVLQHCNTGHQGSCGNICEPEARPEDGLGYNNREEAPLTNVADVNGNETPTIWSAGKEVYVDLTKLNEVNADIRGYNLLGQELFTDRCTSGILYAREMNNISTGYMIIAVENKGKLYTQKVFITH